MSQKDFENFLQSCTECGACKRFCPFLEKYGLPSEIIRNKKEEVFYCTNCGACNFICPEKLNPMEVLFSLKVQLVKEKSLKSREFLRDSYAFVKRGHSFPFVHWDKGDIFFWPGCSLSGTSPSLVKALFVELQKKYANQKVGLLLDCCSDPLYQKGDLDTVEKTWENFNKRFKFYQIKKVILGCTNCYKLFKLYAREIEIAHILEEFPEEFFTHIPEGSLLHFPCPAFKEKEIRSHVIKLFNHKVSEQLKLPYCCGAGGGAYLDGELSESFLNKVLKRGKDKYILTFCMGCKNRFLKAGAKSLHLLETIRPSLATNKPISSQRKWLNRLYLSLSRKIFKKTSFLFLLFFLLLFVGFWLQSQGIFSENFLKKYFEPYASHPLSVLIYLFIYSLAPSLFISSLGLTLLAGFLWGPFKGTFLALTGATLGASVSFLLSRYFLKDYIKYKLGYEKWQYVQNLTHKYGWKALAFLRLVPLFPYPIINYLFGLLPLSLKTFFVVSFISMAPAGFAYTYLGFSLKEILIKSNLWPLFWVILFFLILSLLVSFITKKWKL